MIEPRRDVNNSGLETQAGSDAIPPGAIAAVVEGRCGDPFAVLGPHGSGNAVFVRAFVPGAFRLWLTNEAGPPLEPLARLHDAGFFSGNPCAHESLPCS